MRRHGTIGLFAVTVAALGAGSCCDSTLVEPITGLPRSLSPAERQVIAASNDFAFGLLRESRADQPEHNTFLAPLSVSMALGMTMNGAAGETWSQMRDVLGFDDMEEQQINEAYRDLIELLLTLDPSLEVGIGNSTWADSSRITLLSDFVERLETYFDAEAATLDFDDPAARDAINDWVAEVTNDRITDLIERIPAEAVLFLVNAIYFKGDWRTTFDQDNTRSASFTRANGSTVSVSMMSDDVGYRTLNAGNPDAVQGVELPYGGGAFTAVALLPPQGVEIDTFVADLDIVDWREWIAHFDAQAEAEDLEGDGVPIRLPKFTLEWKSDLVPSLQTLGMTDVFDDELADLSRIDGGLARLFVMEVLHSTYVKVDEEGTEAAAATSVSVGVTAVPVSITFNRPFVFAIRERYSGTILFLGVIGDPAEA